MKKKILVCLIIASVLIIAFIVFQINNDVSNSTAVSAIQKPSENSFKISRIGEKTLSFEDDNFLNELYDKIMNKGIKRIPVKLGIEMIKESVYIVEYNGGKGAFFRLNKV